MNIKITFDQECDFEISLEDSCVIPLTFSNDNNYELYMDADD